MRDQEAFTNQETPECTCTGRLLVGARHSPGPQTNSDAVRPCGQRMEKQYLSGRGRNPAGGRAAVALLWFQWGWAFKLSQAGVRVSEFVLELELLQRSWRKVSRKMEQQSRLMLAALALEKKKKADLRIC